MVLKELSRPVFQSLLDSINCLMTWQFCQVNFYVSSLNNKLKKFAHDNSISPPYLKLNFLIIYYLVGQLSHPPFIIYVGNLDTLVALAGTALSFCLVIGVPNTSVSNRAV